MIAIKIENINIALVYAPVSTAPREQVNIFYEPISEFLQTSQDQGKEALIIGDLNSHVNGHCWENQNDHSGQKLEDLINAYGL